MRLPGTLGSAVVVGVQRAQRQGVCFVWCRGLAVRSDKRQDDRIEPPRRTATAESWTSSPAHSPDPFPYFAKFVTGQEPVEKSTWLTDLELMHHYTSSTYLTLPRATELQQVWQIEVPKLALSHVFLLHQVLSVSAYHLAYLHPDRPSLSICASQHQNKAVAGLRSAVSVITEESCPEIFVASSLLSIGAFSAFSIQSGRGERPRIDDLLDVFSLVRGMSDILNSYQPALNSSKLGSLFIRDNANEPAPVLRAMLEQLRQLAIPGTVEPEIASLCREEIASIVQWVDGCIATTRLPELRVAMSLSISASTEFLDLMRQRHPVALSVLAHYCVVLHHAGLEHWYMGVWGRSVIFDISESIDAEWKPLLEWPLTATETY
ncbi:hypothetical protein ACJ41O_015270 [Fusarium nematophilum]